MGADTRRMALVLASGFDTQANIGGDTVITGIDHVVVVVQDLEAAVRDYTALGFTVTPGGTHADGKTHNALITFADGSYIEILAFLDRVHSFEHPWRRRLDEGEGIEDFAIGSDDLEADVARIRVDGARSGLEVGQVVDGGRRRPDGQELRWRTTRFLQPKGDAAVPFIIQDVTARELRVPGGTATQHRLAVAGIAGVRVAVRDLQEQSERYAALLERRGVAEDGEHTRIPLGEQWIELVTPNGGVEGVAERMECHGEGPFAIVMRAAGAAGGEGAERLDSTRAHGAEIVVPAR